MKVIMNADDFGFSHSSVSFNQIEFQYSYGYPVYYTIFSAILTSRLTPLPLYDSMWMLALYSIFFNSGGFYEI